MNTWLASLEESSLRSIAAVALVVVLLLVLRVRSASLRHAAWTVALAGMLLMPLLPGLVPQTPVPLPLESSWLPAQTSPATPPPVQVANFVEASPMPAARTPTTWPMPLAILYAAGVLCFAIRLAAGYLAMLRLRRHSVFVGALGVRESALVATPMIAGILKPTIILPLEWRTWETAKLDAVLAHERTHARRRDGLLLFIASVNRCIFWFHPVAWWLQNRLATLAEEICDEAGARAFGDRSGYAEILIDMARTVGTQRGRVAWEGALGMGAGRVTGRVERMLNHQPRMESTKVRIALMASACVVVVLLAAACTKKSPVVRITTGYVGNPALERANKNPTVMLTAQQAAQAEASLRTNPDDQKSRARLLDFYRAQKNVAELKRHTLWTIEHHPDWTEVISRYWNGNQDFPEARQLWLKQLAKPGVTAEELETASTFFRLADPAMTENLLLRAHTMAPDKVSMSLGFFYADVLREDAETPFGQQVRKKVEQSSDARLIARTGEILIFHSLAYGEKAAQVEFARSLVKRAMELDPGNGTAASAQLMLTRIAKYQRLKEIQKKLPQRPSLEDIHQLSEPEQFLAMSSGIEHRNTGDLEKAFGALEKVRQIALELARLAPKFRDDPEYGNAVYWANIALGRIAMRSGDVTEAAKYLIQASKTPGSPQIAGEQWGITFELPRALLNYGGKAEKESVAQFLDRCEELRPHDKPQLSAWAAEIRQGKTPDLEPSNGWL